MNPERDFDRRVAEIHFSHGSAATVTDVRREEFRAMVGAFLGDGYDEGKFARLESLHTQLLVRQDELATKYESGEIGPDDYVNRFNAVAFEEFGAMEAILGKDDYLTLFGPLPDRSTGFIDRELFVREHQKRARG
jgi:hypothetical protein